MMEIAVTFWFFMEGLQDQKKTSMDKLRIEWELPLVNQDEAWMKRGVGLEIGDR